MASCSTVTAEDVAPMTVSEIKQLHFHRLSLNEKLSIKKRGRPLPDLAIIKLGISNNKKYVRTFNNEWYERKNWLCGCETVNALFCFPCLLFGGDETWTMNGFKMISKMKEKTEKHEQSKKHIDNVISLSLLGNVDIKEKLNEAYRHSIEEHNIKVKRNHEILSKIIDCILFCGQFEMPLSGHDESELSDNPGLFMGLINFATKLDVDLKQHLDNSTVFKGVSKTIQNEVLDCILQVYRDEILKEIEESSFIAVMADDTTDVSEHTQMVIVLRYLLKGEIHERFWGFFVPESQTADGISTRILEQLKIVLRSNKDKLIAQTFDGANVMKGKKGGVQAKIRSMYPNAHFVHCYAHQLNLIMKNAASVSRNSRIFFSNLLAIPTFFSRSPQRLSILKKHTDVSIPRPSATRWNFNIRTINRVYDNLEPLKQCLTEIQSTSNADTTIAEATGLLQFLNNETFNFWLNLFHEIMPSVDILFNQMQSRELTPFRIKECISNFKIAIQDIRTSPFCDNSSHILVTEAKEVCDCIIVDMEDRYSFSKQLVSAELFDKNKFARFMNELPTNVIEMTVEAYPMLDKKKLGTQLSVFYRRQDMHQYSKLLDLYQYLLELESNLEVALSEIIKLLKILLTIPMTTSEPECCFSTLKRIKTFLRSTMGHERLNALAVISIEKHFFNKYVGIKDRIIDHFAQMKTRRMDFILK